MTLGDGEDLNLYAVGNAGATEHTRPALNLCGVLARTGYTREFAEKIAAMAKDLTGRDDVWSLLAVDADLLADRLDFHGFQRRLLKQHISQMQEAKDALLTPEEYVRVVLANEEATVAVMNRAEQVQERVQGWLHRGTQRTARLSTSCESIISTGVRQKFPWKDLVADIQERILHDAPPHSRRYFTNPDGGFNWAELDPGIRQSIRGLLGSLRVVHTWYRGRDLQGIPPSAEMFVREIWGRSRITLRQEFAIERSRHSVCSHGPRDKLTVSLSENMPIHWSGYRYCAAHGHPLNRAAVEAAMNLAQTWTDVSKIRLPLAPGRRDVSNIEFVRQRRHGEAIVSETVSISPRCQFFTPEDKMLFARKLTEELQLRHAVVGGVDEYSI